MDLQKKVFYLQLENVNNLKTTSKHSFKQTLKCRKFQTENIFTIKIDDQLWIDCDFTKAPLPDLPLTLKIKNGYKIGYDVQRTTHQYDQNQNYRTLLLGM